MTVVEKAQPLLDPTKLALPGRPRIDAIEVQDYIDTTGEGALLLQVILNEDTTDDDITGEAIIAIRRAIREQLLGSGIREFPYVVFAKRSELEEPDIVD